MIFLLVGFDFYSRAIQYITYWETSYAQMFIPIGAIFIILAIIYVARNRVMLDMIIISIISLIIGTIFLIWGLGLYVQGIALYSPEEYWFSPQTLAPFLIIPSAIIIFLVVIGGIYVYIRPQKEQWKFNLLSYFFVFLCLVSKQLLIKAYLQFTDLCEPINSLSLVGSSELSKKDVKELFGVKTSRNWRHKPRVIYFICQYF